MKLTVLGSGGWIPTLQRETCTYLCEYKDSLIILDAGSGISRFKEYKDLLEKYKNIVIILSHYHLDHIIGLSYLPSFLKGKNLKVYAPSKNFYDKSSRDILVDFTTYPYFAHSIEKLSKNVEILEYDTNGFYVEDLKVNILEQKHSAPSFGITLGEYLHYATDTSILNETFKRANKTKLLLHECWDIKQKEGSYHSSLELIIDKSQLLENTKIGLIHINPTWEEKEFEQTKELIENRDIFIVEDELVYKF